jgi:hypothetical protein
VYTRRHFLILSFVSSLLAGCAASETRSLVNKDDIPASKYKKVAIFIENLDEAERPAAEKIVVAALQNAGVNAASGPDIFKGRGTKLSEKAKASIVQKEFDAIIYLTVVEKGLVEELIPNAFFDGQMVQYNLGIMTVGHDLTDMYIIKSDGSVYQPMLALKTKVDMQDTKSAKPVWTSETISSGHAKTTNMPALFTQASNQIVAKMREDSTI